ncbi:MAG: PGPGW domain-containing protein [Verrucomicrobiota bacterium]
MKPIRKVAIFLIGMVLVALGVVLLPLPGPGTLVILGGLAVLSMEFEWAKRWMRKIKEKVPWKKRDRYSEIGRGKRYEDL